MGGMLPGWTQHLDEDSGRHYYYNAGEAEGRDRRVTWDRPCGGEIGKVDTDPVDTKSWWNQTPADDSIGATEISSSAGKLDMSSSVGRVPIGDFETGSRRLQPSSQAYVVGHNRKGEVASVWRPKDPAVTIPAGAVPPTGAVGVAPGR
jgi:hypothetical protein